MKLQFTLIKFWYFIDLNFLLWYIVGIWPFSSLKLRCYEVIKVLCVLVVGTATLFKQCGLCFDGKVNLWQELGKYSTFFGNFTALLWQTKLKFCGLDKKLFIDLEILKSRNFSSNSCQNGRLKLQLDCELRPGDQRYQEVSVANRGNVLPTMEVVQQKWIHPWF